jgi:preprotein translocase subunit SecB
LRRPGPRSSGEWNPQIGLDLNTSVNNVEGDLREVVLTVTVSAKQGDRTVFLIEVKQAGAFLMQNLSPEDFKRAAGVICRACCSHVAPRPNLISQGGFPQLLLPPVNFEALFTANAEAAANATRN